jgi:uncharacterized OB-fold protein
MVTEKSIDAQPYWEALEKKKLVFQKCSDCGIFRHYPQPMCAHCHSMSVAWEEASGLGTVHSWTITYRTSLPDFAGHVPYVLITAEMEEGVRMVAPLRCSASPVLTIGAPVQIVFPSAEDGSMLPVFVLSNLNSF